MIVALIMAGGRGKRFWPLSTDEKPKQFLNLIGKETMIQMTVNRIRKIIPEERIFIGTGKCYESLAKEQLPDIPDENFILEPIGRNTAPCIALAALIIKRYYNDATMLVLPSDHLIEDTDKFLNILKVADKYIDKKNEAIVTLGITPSRAETGYGYIKYENNVEYIDENIINKVESFVEKPDVVKAKEYLDSGEYLWNSGMFLWRCETILNEINKYIPDMYNILKNIEKVDKGHIQEFIDEKYKNTQSISIDYAVLEKSNSIYIIQSDIGWDDIGSFNAIERYRDKDSNGNIVIGNGYSLSGKNNLIISTNKKVIIDDLDDIYLIENDNKIILGKKSDMNNLLRIKDLEQ